MSNIYDLDTPALLVDLDRLERNIAEMAQIVQGGGKALRPHTKTHKTPEIARMQANAGAQGLTVAKLGEAEVMADAGFDDLFVANQIVGEAKIARLLALLRRAQVRIGVDSSEVAGPIGNAARAQGLLAPVMIEVDTGLGRAGVRSPEESLDLARFVADHPGLDLAGIFTHEGHLYRAPEAERPLLAARVASDMRALTAALAAQGTPAREISIGSTPGVALLAEEVGLTEMRPGNYVFLDRMQVQIGAPRDHCALTVLATVVSVRPDGKIILDAGTKALASDRLPSDQTFGEIVDRPELAFVAASEEHGHLQAPGPTRLRVGDKVRILPNHACTCVNMHETMTAYRGEEVEAAWPIAARGKIQ
ncbi:MAG TPA: alanine racemase [Chthonomonadaceae bacterium]|nr:alanine racemase [Chthonomonadaceae bacterium]